MAEPQHWRLALNNHLQATQSTHLVSWTNPPSPRSGVWTITLLWNGEPFRTGHGSSKGVAKEHAAKQAIQYLNPTLYAQMVTCYGC
ncbi:hypothetical protein SCHPADRAFT_898029 [Schizopora paradoxa]|uniref:DRBM domain-containing protein n=1 Tax=Schizopora paradoxa TaxID=27342 RepID=A0A0H2S946_9AGAM|nr:hypothetical protein SCHPADRAFT_898029 [Schizopora paradoxa]